MGEYRLRFKHTLNELVNTENGRDAKTQCKEYGVNRYVFLAIAMYAMLTLGRFMWAYPSFYDMLLKAGAYSWLCKEGEGSRLIEGLQRQLTCDARDMAINAVLLTVSGSTFMGSIFGAATNIALGAKLSSMIGASSMFLGMLTVGFSNIRFPLYIPGAIMVGFGMDFLVFPSFNATMLFPNRKLLITSILTSTLSVGMFIPILMKYMVWELNFKFPYLMLGYTFLTAGVLLVLFMLYYPPKRFYEQAEIDNAYQMSHVESQIEGQYKKGNGRRNSKNDRYEASDPRPSRQEKFLFIFGISNDKYKVLKRSLASHHFLLISVIFSIITIASTYYVLITSKLHNQAERTYLSFGIASSFLISIIASPILDKLGSMLIMWYEVCCLLPSLILVIIPYQTTKILSIVAYSLFTAYSNGQIWLFVVETFDPAINTLILGMLNAMAGLVTFSASSIFQKLIRDYGWISQMLIFVNVLVALQLVLVGVLHYIKRKTKKIE